MHTEDDVRVGFLEIVNELGDRLQLLEVAIGAPDLVVGSPDLVHRQVQHQLRARRVVGDLRQEVEDALGDDAVHGDVHDARLDLRHDEADDLVEVRAYELVAPDSVTQTGTFCRVGNTRPYSSTERSSTFFCQMSHVRQRDGHE